jgi:hypothetical protein
VTTAERATRRKRDPTKIGYSRGNNQKIIGPPQFAQAIASLISAFLSDCDPFLFLEHTTPPHFD